MYKLEKYRGPKSRFTCPGCGSRQQFARYIDDEGNYLDPSVGRCNKESSCRYHLTPKKSGLLPNFRSHNAEQLNARSRMSSSKRLNVVNKLSGLHTANTLEQFDIIDNSFVIRSLEYTSHNRFLNYLLTFIDHAHVEDMVKKYFIGSTKEGKTCFWMIDGKGRARTGKIIAYNPQTGKRDKTVHPSWIHYELKKHKLLPETFEHRLCCFGEHLLRTETRKPIAIVEAEKTAAVASIFLDEFVWLAIGGKSYLKAAKLQRFRNRKIVLFPDADSFDLWSREAEDGQKIKLNVSVSRIIEDLATEEEKKQGFDLADYLIRSELAAQKYNRKLDIILDSEDQQDYLYELIEERLAIISESESIDEEKFISGNNDLIRRTIENMNL